MINLERSRNYLNQLIKSSGFKLVSIFLSYVSYPIMLSYLGGGEFGVWVTLFSVVSWFSIMDLGIGSGLRNVLSKYIAVGDEDNISKTISHAYSILSIVSVLMWFLSLFASYVIPWGRVFNTSAVSEFDLRLTVQITVSGLMLSFLSNLIFSILFAYQKSGKVAFLQFANNLTSLVLLVFSVRYFPSSILVVALIVSFSMVAPGLVFTFFFFKKKDKIKLKWNLIDRGLDSIVKTGFQFFFIQIAVLVIFSTDRILIAQFFSPTLVTEYDIVLKVFSVLSMVHSVICSPLLPAYADAYHRNDFDWIKKNILFQIILFLLFFIAIVFVTIFFRFIVIHWIGPSVVYSHELVLSTAILVCLMIWNNVFGTLLGAIGKIRLGSFYTILMAILNIPLSYYFSVIIEFGISGIVIGSILSILLSSLISPVQVYYFIFSNKKNLILNEILR